MARRIVFTLVLMIICSKQAPAQLGFGPEAGAGMSSMHFAPLQGFTSASGSSVISWKFGVLIDHGMNKHIYFQAGIFISQKGENREFSFYTNDTLNASFHQTLTLYYVEVPVGVVYKTGMQGKGRICLGIGSSPSYLLGGSNQLSREVSYRGTPQSSNFDKKVSYRNPLAMFDIGLNITAGYELPTGLFFRAYYTPGIRDIGLASETDKNRMWGVSAGYLFGKGRNINKEKNDLIDRSED